MEFDKSFVSKRVCYDLIEKSVDKQWAQVVSQLVTNYPLQKHLKVRHISTAEALRELKEMAVQMKPLQTLAWQNQLPTMELQCITALLLNHLSVVMGRNVVEMLLNLVQSTQEHVEYWSQQRHRSSASSSISKKNSKSRLWFIGGEGKNEESVMKRLQEFDRLKSDLLQQIGHIQTWVWTLHRIHGYSINAGSSGNPSSSQQSQQLQYQQQQQQQHQYQQHHHQHQHSHHKHPRSDRNDTQLSVLLQNIYPFIIEMRDLFLQKPSQIIGVEQLGCMEWLNIFVENLYACEFFMLKFEQDIQFWGGKSSTFFPIEHISRYGNYYAYGFVCLSSAALFAYHIQTTPDNKYSPSSLWSWLSRTTKDYIYNPLRATIYQGLGLDKIHGNELNRQDTLTLQRAEQKNLDNMLKTAGYDNMDQLQKDYAQELKFPVRNVVLGDLMQHWLIQMQHMKYETALIKHHLAEMMNKNEVFWMFTLGIVPTCFLSYEIFKALRWTAWTSISWLPFFNNQDKKTQESTKMRRWLRELHSIIAKHIGQQYIGDNDCGVLLGIVREISVWSSTGAKKGQISNEENEWLQFDLNHLISQQFTVQQSITLVHRLERFYL